jgi:hypothetical protein
MYCWMLSICCSEWRIEADLLEYMVGTYLSFIDISYDVLLKHFFWISWCMHLAYVGLHIRTCELMS